MTFHIFSDIDRVSKRDLNILFLIQYNDLRKKKRIVENDKAKILETIEELDQKKNEALNVAWQKVEFLS